MGTVRSYCCFLSELLGFCWGGGRWGRWTLGMAVFGGGVAFRLKIGERDGEG